MICAVDRYNLTVVPVSILLVTKKYPDDCLADACAKDSTNPVPALVEKKGKGLFQHLSRHANSGSSNANAFILTRFYT